MVILEIVFLHMVNLCLDIKGKYTDEVIITYYLMLQPQ